MKEDFKSNFDFVLKVAKVLCDAQGEYDWDGVRDVEGNPSTAYLYKDYIKMARKVIAALKLSERL